MSRLPIPGSDDGQWGDILNDYLANVVLHTIGNETVAGIKTFSSAPIVPTPTNGTEAANKAYVDSVGSGGAPDANTTTKGLVQLTGDLSGTAASPTVPGLTGKEPTITAGTTGQYYRGDKSWQTLDKSAVGLGSVDNTSDATKNSASVTLTNKTISGASNTLSNIPQSAVTSLTSDLSAKAADAAVVHLTGSETISGNKNFTGALQTGGLTVANLDVSGHVPVSQLGSGTPDGTKFLRDDQTYAAPPTATAVQYQDFVYTIESKDGSTAIATGAGIAKYVTGWGGIIDSVQVCNGAGVVSGTVTVDINKNGTTVFTTQANRPKVLTTDANGVGISATPDVTTFVSGDRLSVDLDGISATEQAATNQITIIIRVHRTS